MHTNSIHGFFELISSLKNEDFCVKAPPGQNLIRFLKKKSGLKSPKIREFLRQLEKDNLIINETHGNQVMEIKICGESPQKEGPVQDEKSKRTFALFIDYKNLENNLPNAYEKLRDFSWLINPILNVGKIIFAFVFIPEHYLSKAPVQQLSYKHRFNIIVCPRQISGIVTKDVDTVDAVMSELAHEIISHSDLTDVIIVSGDADFKQLATFAIWQQKKVKIVSATDAISGHFLRMENGDKMTVELV